MYSMICAPSDHGASNMARGGKPVNAIGEFLDWWFTSQMCHLWPPIRDLVLPYTNVAFNYAILQSNVRWGRFLPRKTVAYLDPVLADFPSLFDGVLNFDVCRTKPQRFLSPKLLERATDIYEASWYGTRVAPLETLAPTAKMYYDRWWSRWTSAVICERLLLRGRSLKVG